MTLSTLVDNAEANFSLEVLWEDEERVFCRAWHDDSDGDHRGFLAVLPSAEHPPSASIDRLAHEFTLKDEWTVAGQHAP